MSLRLAFHQSPVDGRNLVLLQHWQRALEGTAVATRHVLRAKQRAAEAFERSDRPLQIVRFSVVVKRYHVRLFELYPSHRAELCVLGPVTLPHSASQRLRCLG